MRESLERILALKGKGLAGLGGLTFRARRGHRVFAISLGKLCS